MAKTKDEPQKDSAEVALRKALASAPTVHEVLAKPEHYEQWYKASREVLANG